MSIFNKVQFAKPEQSVFDLSFDNKFTGNMGELIPVFCKEVLPGDSWEIEPEAMLRFQPLIAPVMHRVKVSTHFFFVPNRLLWSGWEKFITNDPNAGEHPYIELNDGFWNPGTVHEYLGYPTTFMNNGARVSPLKVAAYLKVWDDYYRDQNLQNEQFQPLVDGENGGVYTSQLYPLRRAWQHDYFTSCLPFAQKGDAVQLPLVEQENILVEYDSALATGNPNWKRITTGIQPNGTLEQDGLPSRVHIGDDNPLGYDPQGTLNVDVQAGATTLNALRVAARVQEWLERMARGGSRYIETILSHFGVRSSDTRLQRPEYIGGLRQNMVISEVLSTAQTDNAEGNITNPVGQMAGYGVSVARGNQFRYRSEEHGFIIGIMNVQPTTAYQQGVDRGMFRFLPTDYAWPSFAHLGEQAVLMREIYASAADPEAVFGYIPMYSEYKYSNSEVHGEMRDTLNFWHMGRIFENEPVLNDEFIQCQPRQDAFAVLTGGEVIAHAYFKVTARRKLPRYSVPRL